MDIDMDEIRQRFASDKQQRTEADQQLILVRKDAYNALERTVFETQETVRRLERMVNDLQANVKTLTTKLEEKGDVRETTQSALLDSHQAS